MHVIRVLLAFLSLSLSVLANPLLLEKRDTVNNVCAEMPDCELECLSPATKEKIVPNDCHVIFDTLLFIVQDESPTNTVAAGGNITMFYNTCKSFFLNQDTESIEYCRLTWAEKLQLMTSTCHSRGAKCVGPSGTWSIEFEHS